MHKNILSGKLLIIGILAFALAGFAFAPASADGFTHGRVFIVDGEEYYMAGAPDGPGGAFDIPGHTWVQAGPNRVVGKHYNTGPGGAEKWWSSTASNGALLFMVQGIFDTWSPEKADSYAARGYVHYHELLDVDTLDEHPTKVVWLKHTAVSTFNFDGGPRPDLRHVVSPGVDYEFIPLGDEPYNP
jgi:hypothetical protein